MWLLKVGTVMRYITASLYYAANVRRSPRATSLKIKKCVEICGNRFVNRGNGFTVSAHSFVNLPSKMNYFTQPPSLRMIVCMTCLIRGLSSMHHITHTETHLINNTVLLLLLLLLLLLILLLLLLKRGPGASTPLLDSSAQSSCRLKVFLWSKSYRIHRD